MKIAVLLLIAAASLHPQELAHSTEAIPIHTVRPQYTEEATAAKIQGEVTLSVTIGLDGVPSDIKLVRGLGSGLDEKAVECLQQWRFKPATSYGEPVFGKATVKIRFQLYQPPFLYHPGKSK
jgi:TonB family protein